MAKPVDRRLVPTAVALAAVVVAGVASAQLEPLRGTVVNQADRGLKDVWVTLGGPAGDQAEVERITDEDGRFEIPMEHVRPGLEIHLHKDGYEEVTVLITAQHLVVADLRIAMQPIREEPTPQPATPTPPPTLVTAERRREAIQLYNEAVEEYGEEEPAKKRAAEHKFREAASLDPGFVEPQQILLSLAMKRENWTEASRWAADLVRLQPKDLEAARTLYTCVIITRHHERVGDAARHLVRLDPTAITYVEEHARTFLTNQHYPMARALYEVLAEISPQPAFAYLNLGVCCVALGDLDGARAAFEAFLETAPEDDPDRAAVEADLAALNETAD